MGRSGVFKLKNILIVLAVILPIFMVAASGSRTNPKVERTISWDSPETEELFYKACANCHSYETKWPWYSYVAPASWLVIRNVNHAREEFNISSENLGEADEAAEKLSEDKMPPWDYLLLHGEAKLSAQQKEKLVAGLEKTFGRKHEAGEGAADDDDDSHDDH